MQPDNNPSIELEDFPGYIRLTWDDVEMLAWQVGLQLMEHSGPFHNIITLSRGGLVPTGLLTQFKSFAKAKVHVVKVSFYDENLPIPRENKDSMVDLSLLGLDWQKLNVDSTLIFDDLWDSGQSLRQLLNVLPQATYATLLTKKPLKSCQFLSATGMEVDTNRWVVFPWEEISERGAQSVRQANKTKAKLVKASLEGVTFEDYTNIKRMWDAGLPSPFIKAALLNEYGRDLTLETIRKVLDDGKP